jgi:hypothetical protein
MEAILPSARVVGNDHTDVAIRHLPVLRTAAAGTGPDSLSTPVAYGRWAAAVTRRAT